MELRECFDRVGPELVGFVPDFSSSMTGPPNLHWERLRALEVPDEVIDFAKAVWGSDKPVPEKFGALAEAAGRFGLSDAAKAQLMMTLTMFGRAPVEQLAGLLPYTKHIHGKFYEVDASGNEPSLPYPELFAVLMQGGFQRHHLGRVGGPRLHRGAHRLRAGAGLESDVHEAARRLRGSR